MYTDDAAIRAFDEPPLRAAGDGVGENLAQVACGVGLTFIQQQVFQFLGELFVCTRGVLVVGEDGLRVLVADEEEFLFLRALAGGVPEGADGRQRDTHDGDRDQQPDVGEAGARVH